jgi:hypothetical protein
MVGKLFALSALLCCIALTGCAKTGGDTAGGGGGGGGDQQIKIKPGQTITLERKTPSAGGGGGGSGGQKGGSGSD